MRILTQAEVTCLRGGWGRCSNRQSSKTERVHANGAEVEGKADSVPSAQPDTLTPGPRLEPKSSQMPNQLTHPGTSGGRWIHFFGAGAQPRPTGSCHEKEPSLATPTVQHPGHGQRHRPA
uniref:Uncharacterized protein n=1 Tax=Mustela putorius furo TaxID=9669 RepID=M3YAD2_MUSPF